MPTKKLSKQMLRVMQEIRARQPHAMLPDIQTTVARETLNMLRHGVPRDKAQALWSLKEGVYKAIRALEAEKLVTNNPETKQDVEERLKPELTEHTVSLLEKFQRRYYFLTERGNEVLDNSTLTTKNKGG